MNIFIFADESGVFDKKNNRFFIFGGLIFLDKSNKDICSRRYSSLERKIKTSEMMNTEDECKASLVKPLSKRKLYASLNYDEKFGCVIYQNKLLDEIFENKKHKQRYLDYAFKRAIKHKLCDLIRRGLLDPNEVENIYVMFDEHSTATDGRYELRESLEKEFKIGMFSRNYLSYHNPLFPAMTGGVTVRYCDSSSVILIRAADIIANRILHEVREGSGKINPSFVTETLSILYLPR